MKKTTINIASLLDELKNLTKTEEFNHQQAVDIITAIIEKIEEDLPKKNKLMEIGIPVLKNVIFTFLADKIDLVDLPDKEVFKDLIVYIQKQIATFL